MALTATTSTAAIGASDTVIPLTSSTGFLPGQPVRIDSEFMYVVTVPSTTSITVRSRGSEGTAAAVHSVLSNVITGLASDFPIVPPGQPTQINPSNYDVQTIGANTAIIPAPQKNTDYIITKGSALATTTLAAPTTAQNGTVARFTSQTAFAHVITGATLFENGLTGSPFSTLTFGAFIGAGITLIAQNGVWNVAAIPIAASVVVS